MKENLYVVKFADGTIIPEAKTKEEWIMANEKGKPAWCYYDFDSTTANVGVNSGKFYNGYAVKDLRGLAPKGWHIPSEKEWDVLINYSGGSEIGGLKMKSVFGWKGRRKDNGGGEIGVISFAGLPSGSIHADGYSSRREEYGLWWSSTKDADNLISVCELIGIEPWVVLEHHTMSFGHSVRCIKN
jgi:uncharacterized protein (TIGR02145 family)